MLALLLSLLPLLALLSLLALRLLPLRLLLLPRCPCRLRSEPPAALLVLLLLVAGLVSAQSTPSNISAACWPSRSDLALLARCPSGLLRVPPWSCRWFLAGRLGDFLIDLIGEIFELALGPPEGRRFVAQDAPGRPFDALSHLLDPLAGVPRRLGGVFAHAQLGQLLGGFERIGDLLFVRLSDRIVEILGQERLGFLGILHGVSHLVEKLVEVLLLLFESLGDLLAFAGVAKRGLRAILGGLKLFGELFLILVETPRLVAHLGHFLRESVGRSLAQLFAQVIELPAGSRPFGEGLRNAPFLECLGGLTDVLAALVNLLACVGHAVAILFALHPFPELVGIAEDLLLLFPQPLELSLDFLACGLRLGGLEGRLQLFEPIIHVVLPLGELAQAIENLPGFALLLLSLREPFLLGSGRSLIFVAVFLVGELELLELPLRAVAARVAAALPLLARVAANDLKFSCAQLEQGLIGRLLGGQGRVEACHRRLLGHFAEVLLRRLSSSGSPVPGWPSRPRLADARRAGPPARSRFFATLPAPWRLRRASSVGLAAVSRRISFQVPLMISFCSSARRSLAWALPCWPSCSSFSADPLGGCSPWRKISSNGRTSAKNMSPDVRRGWPSGPMSSAQKK